MNQKGRRRGSERSNVKLVGSREERFGGWAMSFILGMEALASFSEKGHGEHMSY